ncbi:MAG: DUF2971 domain-containing protein [Akkermansia sp.]|nr:DUF2971 domain-containing protein [Akkermansia sp.]
MAYEANDPFELTPQAKDEFSPVDLSARAAKGSPPPFISFSRKITAPALWGHYADSGKGVCLVFCFPCKEFKENINILRFADSTDFRVLAKINNKLSASNIAKVSYRQERIDPFPTGDTDDTLAWFTKLISTKGETWRYENEYRLITNYDCADQAANGMLLFSWPMCFLMGAVTGPMCPYSPQYVKRILSDKYDTVKDSYPNYYIENQKIIGRKFIVTPANYHWKDFEIEAAPWYDNLYNTNVLNSYLEYLAMRNNEPIPEIDIETDNISYQKITSWNDYKRSHKPNEYCVFIAGEKDGASNTIDTSEMSYILNLIREKQAKLKEQ